MGAFDIQVLEHSNQFKVNLMLFSVIILIFNQVETSADQISGCYSMGPNQHSIEISWQATNPRDNCVSSQFLTSDRNEILSLKINGCKNTHDFNELTNKIVIDSFINLQIFDISHSELISLNFIQLKYHHLKVFNASYNKIGSIPKDFFDKMKNIEIIDISHNNLKNCYRFSIFKTEKLLVLNVSNNEITSLWMPKDLKVLDASNNHIDNFKWTELGNLKVLNLMNNSFTHINCDFISTSLATVFVSSYNLQEMDFQCPSIHIEVDFNDEIIFRPSTSQIELKCSRSLLKKLRSFKFSQGKKFRQHQNETRNLIKLMGSSIEELNLCGSYLEKIDTNTFRELRQLKVLNLSNTELERFSVRFIDYIRNLKFLDISGNKLKRICGIPRTKSKNNAQYKSNFDAQLRRSKRFHLLNFDNLTVFRANGNQITNMMEFLRLLGQSIKELDLSGNLLNEVEHDTFEKMINLKYLYLSKTNLTTFNFDTIGHLKQLNRIDISGNKIQRFTSMPILESFDKLSQFHVNDNNLENTVSIIEYLPSSIEVLNLSGNFVKEIKTIMFLTLRKISRLDLSRTNLSMFEFSTIENLMNLKYLDISNNSLKIVNFSLSRNSVPLKKLHLDMNELMVLDTLSVVNFPRLIYLNISKNRFSCDYVEKFQRQWEPTTKIYGDSCYDDTKAHDFNVEVFKRFSRSEKNASKKLFSNATQSIDTFSTMVLVLCIVPPCAAMFIVAVFILVWILRRRRLVGNRADTSNWQQESTFNQIEMKCHTNEYDDPNEHIYEEIKECPVIYDRLKFDTDAMPFSQHTINHYDNVGAVKRKKSN